MNETKRIDLAKLEGKEPIAVGYKIFDWRWAGHNNYCYADKDGDVEGSVHTVTGELSECGWGLHYCENPLDCMRYRELVQWNRFALVEAYDENIKGEDKSVCRTLMIKKVLTFDEMVEACKSYQKEAVDGISYGYGIRNGYGISNGDGISDSYGISDGSGVYNSMSCSKCEGVSRCLWCYELEGARLMIFNKPVDKKRFNKVCAELKGFGWTPDFTTATELKAEYGDGKWEQTPAPAITGRTSKEAYAEMPSEMLAYIKALPEYDDEIFRAITEAEE